MTTGARIGWRCILVLIGIPTGASIVCVTISSVMITNFELDKHFLVVRFPPVSSRFFKAEPSASNPSDIDHPSCKTRSATS